ncbi:MAG: hypothetical protein ACR2G7_03940 [Acidimicrobiales bacterium]
MLLCHWGDPVGRVRWQDGRCLSEPPAEGFLVDCLRRALVRPTPPPAASTTRLFATIWLENVVRQSRRGSRHLGWKAVVALHPAVQLLARNGQPAGGSFPFWPQNRGEFVSLLGPERAEDDDLVATARALGNVCDWSMVRRQVIRGWKAGLDAPLAVWMDTGMLSRWLLDSREDVDDLMDQLAATCSASVLHRIRQTFTALGLVGAATPQAGHLARAERSAGEGARAGRRLPRRHGRAGIATVAGLADEVTGQAADAD